MRPNGKLSNLRIVIEGDTWRDGVGCGGAYHDRRDADAEAHGSVHDRRGSFQMPTFPCRLWSMKRAAPPCFWRYGSSFGSDAK